MDFPNTLKEKSISNIFSNITSSEILDPQVEGFIKESTESLIDTILENAAMIAKHKGEDTISQDDILFSFYKFAGIVEPGFSSVYNTFKLQEVNKNQTQDHKKRIEISKEENKTTNE